MTPAEYRTGDAPANDEPGCLLVFGLGYTGAAIATLAAASGWRVIATSRTPDGKRAPSGVELIDFAASGDALDAVTHVLETAAPDEGGDPALARHGDALRAASALRWAGLLSTTGVYGDRDGGWVDETTPPAPTGPRGIRRLEQEQQWAAAFARCAVDLFRVAGIYGPGRSPFAEIRAGRARRVDKPGHRFGRIHRDDIARAVVAAIAQARPVAAMGQARPVPAMGQARPVPAMGQARPVAATGQARPGACDSGPRVLNLNDDLPVETAEVTAEAARLIGMPPPPLVPFAQALEEMSEMGRSFWAENRQVSSRQTQAALGLAWRYPTYRDGLRAILEQERAKDPAQQP